MYTPEKGDIVSINFDPSAGKEIIKRRPAFVISRKQFNEHTGFAIVAPITSTVRGMRLEVVLDDDMEIQGAILVYQIKSLDFQSRDIQFIEKAPVKIIEQATSLSKIILS